MSKWHRVIISAKDDEPLDVDILHNIKFHDRIKIKTFNSDGKLTVIGKFKASEDAMAFKLAFE